MPPSMTAVYGKQMVFTEFVATSGQWTRTLILVVVLHVVLYACAHVIRVSIVGSRCACIWFES